ncbi:MAG: hypothetical protein GY795_25235 [Desulfobacterales bacterium]|nr:hypothetical protein [Desulfobacterales bacterium]
MAKKVYCCSDSEKRTDQERIYSSPVNKRSICFVFLLSVFIFASCAPVKTVKSIQVPACRHNAVYQAVTFGDQSGSPVRIAVGRSTVDKYIRHAQAQAYVNGRWEYLKMYDSSIGVGSKEPFKPVSYYTVTDFTRIHLKIVNPN